MIDMNKFTLTKHDPEITELINTTDHKILAIWAIDCLYRILPIYEQKYPNEKTPHNAVKILNQWIDNKIKMWDARKYCWEVLKLAREIESKDKVGCQILRAASHGLATCHVKTHSEGPAMYAISVIKIINKDKKNVVELMENERIWQIEHLKNLIDQTS